LAEEMVDTIRRPILYFDYFNWIFFDGLAQNNKICYSKILPIKSLVPFHAIKDLETGGKIKIFDSNIVIYSNNKIINKIKTEKEAIILNFT
jgi:hypothetical protein